MAKGKKGALATARPERFGSTGLNHPAERKRNEAGRKWGNTIGRCRENGRFAGVSVVYTEKVASSRLAAPTTVFSHFSLYTREVRLTTMNHQKSKALDARLRKDGLYRA